jgi:hypothetical protein
MVERLRQSIVKLGTARPSVAPAERSDILDRKALADLQRELATQEAGSFPAGKVIMSAGAVGAFMYIVVEGRVAISVDGGVVERVGPGGMFGERWRWSTVPPARPRRAQRPTASCSRSTGPIFSDWSNPSPRSARRC